MDSLSLGKTLVGPSPREARGSPTQPGALGVLSQGRSQGVPPLCSALQSSSLGKDAKTARDARRPQSSNQVPSNTEMLLSRVVLFLRWRRHARGACWAGRLPLCDSGQRGCLGLRTLFLVPRVPPHLPPAWTLPASPLSGLLTETACSMLSPPLLRKRLWPPRVLRNLLAADLLLLILTPAGGCRLKTLCWKGVLMGRLILRVDLGSASASPKAGTIHRARAETVTKSAFCVPQRVLCVARVGEVISRPPPRDSAGVILPAAVLRSAGVYDWLSLERDPV